MECDEVVPVLWEYLDRALAAEEAAAIGAHLVICPHCLPTYRFDRSFLALIARAARGCPDTPPRLVFAIRTIVAGPQ